MNDNETVHIAPLDIPTRTQHAEVNGSQVIASTAMPEPVIHALVALVDAVSAAFRAKDDAEREADAALSRRPCPYHYGQLADYCGPCRSEQIARVEEAS
ncbi:MAG TPA: hypothetical protein VFH56_13805, partial [Acidimicrobiales bacterium]|nr:hypothetical protein [Acidimicrobiales bacterium]